jgi:hypothetical protein
MYILLHITLRFSQSFMISSHISFLIPDIRYVLLQDLFIDIDQLCWDSPLPRQPIHSQAPPSQSIDHISLLRSSALNFQLLLAGMETKDHIEHIVGEPRS